MTIHQINIVSIGLTGVGTFMYLLAFILGIKWKIKNAHGFIRRYRLEKNNSHSRKSGEEYRGDEETISLCIDKLDTVMLDELSSVSETLIM